MDQNKQHTPSDNETTTTTTVDPTKEQNKVRKPRKDSKISVEQLINYLMNHDDFTHTDRPTNSDLQFRGIIEMDPFNKIDVRITGFVANDDRLHFKKLQRFVIDRVAVDRKDWTQISVKRLLDTHLDLSTEHGAINYFINIVKR